ncbi:MAG TPA: hypothetical protein VNE62_03980 [Actinomycetota bacterium]|nr:hypothetical protein [Actinomycetota bacterium]
MKQLSQRNAYLILAFLGVFLVVGAVISESRRTEVQAPSGTRKVKVAGRLGPTAGPSSEGHVAEKKAYLQEEAGKRPKAAAGGLVSFSRFLRAVDVAPLVKQGTPYVVFLSFPDGNQEPKNVEGSIEVTVGRRAIELAEAREEELKALEAQVRTATGEDKAKLERDIGERREYVRQLRGECFCVFAMAVNNSTLGSLQELAANPDVRLVDVPRPVVANLSGWEVYPLLPQRSPVPGQIP